MTYDPSKVTIAFLGKPTVELDGTHVRFRAYANEGVPGMEESREIELVLGTDDPGEIVVAACENAHVWAASLGGNISTREVNVPTGQSMLASAHAIASRIAAAEASEMQPVYDEDDI
jgi:hypothetical protein